jgi:signal transduction histidine kinase
VVTLANQLAIALDNARLYEDLRQSREEVSRATRLSAVGTLAAGIAHEIRNPLVAVRTFLELFPKRLDDPDFLANFGRLALSEVDRIARLITDLMQLTRTHERQLGKVDLAFIVERVSRLLGPEAGKRHVQLTVVTSEALPHVHGDGDQLEQVVLNVILNAVQASPPGATVTVQLQLTRTAVGAPAVRIEVIDRGPGIAPEHREAIFTPFFTTKDGGSGLGLAVAYQLVAEHGGSLDTTPTAGGGATFTIALPVAGPASLPSARAA